jgi:hypothetical protein
MKQRTAVEWLEIHLLGLISFDSEHLRKMYKDKIEKAKIIEETQIIDAHIEGQRVFDDYKHTQWTNDQAEQYYNETYGADATSSPDKI